MSVWGVTVTQSPSETHNTLLCKTNMLYMHVYILETYSASLGAIHEENLRNVIE